MNSSQLEPVFEAIRKDGELALKELQLPPGGEVLDVGTGKGYFAIFLALSGYDVLTGEPGTDDSQYAGKDWEGAALTAGVRDKIRFQHFDASDMPFADDRFGSVFFFGVLHHVAESLRADVVREAVRVCRNPGAVVFFEPRPQTLEMVWESDPEHPLAAIPEDYLEDLRIQSTRLTGEMMDISIFRPAP